MDISHGCQVMWRDGGEVGEGSGVGGTRAGPPRSLLSMLSGFMARVRGGRARAAPPSPQPQEPCPQEAGSYSPERIRRSLAPLKPKPAASSGNGPLTPLQPPGSQRKSSRPS